MEGVNAFFSKEQIFSKEQKTEKSLKEESSRVQKEAKNIINIINKEHN